MSDKFDIGDRVIDDDGDKGRIVGFGRPDRPTVRWDRTGSRCDIDEYYLHLTSKGSEETMEDHDAIAVEVDDEDLRQPIIDKAKRHGYTNGRNGNGSADESSYTNTLYFDSNNTNAGNNKVIWCHMDSHNKYLGKLSENWNQVVEFLEQGDESFEINGRKVQVEEEGVTRFVEVGCWRGRWTLLKSWVELSQSVGIGEGEVYVDGENVAVLDIYDLVDHLEAKLGW